ncbi:MAG: LamG domain-containing protein, partial [Candidatus Cryptobacteroides sp.]
ETKFFSSTASGGIALMTNKTTDNMLFLLYVGAWKIVDAGFAPELDKFYHIVGTWDGENACVYVDGELKSTMEVSGTLKMGNKSPNWVVIGANENTVDASGNLTYLNGHWTGMVPVARLYDKALSAEEVKASYDIDAEGIVLQ